jgi:hypothetical protein
MPLLGHQLLPSARSQSFRWLSSRRLTNTVVAEQQISTLLIPRPATGLDHEPAPSSQTIFIRRMLMLSAHLHGKLEIFQKVPPSPQNYSVLFLSAPSKPHVQPIMPPKFHYLNIT